MTQQALIARLLKIESLHAGATTDGERIASELNELAKRQPLTRSISSFLLHPRIPVDIRHNSKISREQLTDWAAKIAARSGLRISSHPCSLPPAP